MGAGWVNRAQQDAIDRQSPSLLVCEAKPLPLELFFQYPILFLEILNEGLLMLVGPVGECEEEKMQW